MPNSNKKTFSASQLRVALTVLMLLLVAGGGAGFFYGYQQVNKFATEVAQTKANESASANTLSTLNTLESQLETNAPVLEKLNKLYITSELPQFQAIEDVRNYAQRHNLPVSNISFMDSTSSSSSTTPAAGSTTPPAGGAAAPGAAAASSGNYISVTLTLSGDISYQQLLDFLYDIERSMPYIKTDGISVSAGDGGNVNVGSLNLQVLTR